MDETARDFSRQRYRFAVFAALALSYLFVFWQRTGPGVVADQLQSQFGVSAAVLGTMASVQFFLYMALQIPVGLFGDRFGPERLFILGTFLDGVGTLVFSQAHGFSWLLVGRAIVGAGDALIWVNIVLVVGKWFAPTEFGAVLGLTGTCGNIGAVCATIPFAAWIGASGWRLPFLILGFVLVGIAYLDACVLKRTWLPWRGRYIQSQHLRIEKIPVGRALRNVLSERVAWATFLCHFGVMGAYIGYTSLWAVPYYMDVYGMSRAGAAQFVLVGFVGAIVGGPVVGMISDKLGERKRLYTLVQALSTLAWSVVPLAHGAPPVWVAYLVIFVLGFGCGASLLTFASIRDLVPREKSGITSGFANTGGFLSAVLLPIAFGAVVDLVGHGQSAGSVLERAYGFAFLVPTLFSAFGVIGSLLLPNKVRLDTPVSLQTREEHI
jgi:MFS family permease